MPPHPQGPLCWVSNQISMPNLMHCLQQQMCTSRQASMALSHMGSGLLHWCPQWHFLWQEMSLSHLSSHWHPCSLSPLLCLHVSCPLLHLCVPCPLPCLHVSCPLPCLDALHLLHCKYTFLHASFSYLHAPIKGTVIWA